MLSYNQCILPSEVIPELGKKMVLLVGEIFLEPSFLHPRWFINTKKARGREMGLHSLGKVFLHGSFLTLGFICAQQITIGKKCPQIKTKEGDGVVIIIIAFGPYWSIGRLKCSSGIPTLGQPSLSSCPQV